MEDKPRLLIFPFNGNGIEAFGCLGEAYSFLGFVDDTPEKQGVTQFGQRVFGREAFAEFPDAQVLAVPGSPASYLSRRETINSLGLTDGRFAQVIHPAASLSSLAKIGVNVLIMAGVVITSNAIIGSHTCILPNTVIHHDVEVGDWGLIGANVTIAGKTVVEENCYIGSGTSIKDHLRIGAGTLIGLGSNVIKDVAQGSRIAGNPARKLVKKE